MIDFEVTNVSFTLIEQDCVARTSSIHSYRRVGQYLFVVAKLFIFLRGAVPAGERGRKSRVQRLCESHLYELRAPFKSAAPMLRSASTKARGSSLKNSVCVDVSLEIFRV